MGGRGTADDARSRAASETVGLLGPRWVLVCEGDAPRPGDPAPCVVVSLDGRAREAGTVAGAADALPVQSEAATGVLVVRPRGSDAAACVPEASRLVQPGGVVALLSTWSAEDVPALDAVFDAAGLRPWRRRAVRLADAPPSALGALWPAWERRRAASAHGAQRVECVVAAVRPGIAGADLPSGASMLAELFVPRVWRRGR